MPPPLAELRSGAGKRTSPVPLKGGGGRVEESGAARGRGPAEVCKESGAARGRGPAQHTNAGGTGGNASDQRGAGGARDATGGQQEPRAESQQQERRRLWLAERHLELDRVRAQLHSSATAQTSSRDDRRRLREEMRRVRSPGAPLGDDVRRRSPGTSPAHEAPLVERRESAEVMTPRRERLSLHRVRQIRQRSVGGPAEESPERGDEGSLSLPHAEGLAKRTRSLEDPARIFAKAREEAAMRRLGQQSPMPAGVRLGAKPVADGGESSPRPAPNVVRQLPPGLMPTARKDRPAPAGPEAGMASGGAASAGATTGTSAATAAAVAAAAGAHQAAQVAAEDRERLQSAQLLNEAERVIQVLQEQKARLREVFDNGPPSSAATSVAVSSSLTSPGLVQVQTSAGLVQVQTSGSVQVPSNVGSAQIPQDDIDNANSSMNAGLGMSFSSAGSPIKAGSYVSPGGGSSKDSPFVLHNASSASVLTHGSVSSPSVREHDNVDPLTRSMTSTTAPRGAEGTSSAGSKAAAVPALQLRKRPAQGPPTRLDSTASGAPGVLYSPHLPAAREAVNNAPLGSVRGVDSTTSLRSPRSGPSPRSGVPGPHGGTISAPPGNQTRPSHADMGHSSSLATPSSPAAQERMVSARGIPGGASHFWSKGGAGQPMARGVSPAGAGQPIGQPMTRGASPTAVGQPMTRGVSPTSVTQPTRMVSSANASTADHGGVGVTVSPRLVSSGAPPASAAGRVVRPPAHPAHGLPSQSGAVKATPNVPWQNTITRSPSMIGVEHAVSTQISLA